jgi:putative ABC transport system permease protein
MAVGFPAAGTPAPDCGTTTGAVLGLALAVAAGTTLGSVVHGIGAHDPGVLAGSVLVLLLTAVLAAWVPARRAARVDPVVALCAE